MIITLTGATGFIGRRLMNRLRSEGHELRILSRKPGPPQDGIRWFQWDAATSHPPAESLDGVHAVIHLAGEPVFQRWTPEAKKRIRESRGAGTRLLVEALSTASPRPLVLVSSSAIGYYGDRGEQRLTESSKPGKGFLPEVAVEWERAAELAEALGLRVVRLRTGIVLGAEGGALSQMLTPFRLGFGGRLGSGKQWWSWIHLDDLVGLIHFALANPNASGPLNGTAPEPVTNAEFTRTLGRALHRPTFLPAPAFALRLALGEFGNTLLESQRVYPKAAETAGYRFLYPTLEQALDDLLKAPK
jgi:uncharacterized protein (TIGR01777 family)